MDNFTYNKEQRHAIYKLAQEKYQDYLRECRKEIPPINEDAPEHGLKRSGYLCDNMNRAMEDLCLIPDVDLLPEFMAHKPSWATEYWNAWWPVEDWESREDCLAEIIEATKPDTE